MMRENFDQLKLLTRSWLQGAGMFKAVDAVNLGLRWHTGTRKDGVTPEFTHQLSQIQQARSMRGIDDLEAVICTIALHDLPEDKKYDVKWIAHEFGPVGLSVERMSKKFFDTGVEKSTQHYYYELGLDANGSLAKGFDRKHNQSSMVGVFTIPKMHTYMRETEDFVLPMLKEARKNFPSQEPAYTALRYQLREQIHLIQSCLALGEQPSS